MRDLYRSIIIIIIQPPKLEITNKKARMQNRWEFNSLPHCQDYVIDEHFKKSNCDIGLTLCIAQCVSSVSLFRALLYSQLLLSATNVIKSWLIFVAKLILRNGLQNADNQKTKMQQDVTIQPRWRAPCITVIFRAEASCNTNPNYCVTLNPPTHRHCTYSTTEFSPLQVQSQ